MNLEIMPYNINDINMQSWVYNNSKKINRLNNRNRKNINCGFLSCVQTAVNLVVTSPFSALSCFVQEHCIN